MSTMDEIALSQLSVPEKHCDTSLNIDREDELPLALLVDKKKKTPKGSKSSKEDLGDKKKKAKKDKKEKKERKKRAADSNSEGSSKKKLKAEVPQSEIPPVINGSKDEFEVIEITTKAVQNENYKVEKKKKKKPVNSNPKSMLQSAEPEVKVEKDDKISIPKKDSEVKDEKDDYNGSRIRESENDSSAETHSEVQNGTLVKDEVVKDEEGENEDYKWWEDEKFGQGAERWQSLVHNGVIFPPPYEPLPSYVKLYYNGKAVDLPPEAEEVAGFFAALLESDHAKNPVFQKNFFEDFLQVLLENGGCNVEIKDFEKCDFSKMFVYFEKLREEKKTLTRDERKKIKEDRDALEKPYRTCLLNGRKEDVGNFKVEPPGLFRGRGAHPKTGKLKKRVYPEDITLNLSADAPVPEPPAGHKWGAVKHDKSVVWLAMWRENIADNFKYVKLAANSSIKGVSDMKKFETARELKNHIERIRKDYHVMLKDPFMQNRQIATATYLIDVFALRAGGEKGDDEADTVGCCSLRYEHVTLKPPNTVIFDFLGKDSIRYYQEVNVERQVFKNFRIFKKEPKQPGDDLFDRIAPSTLNKHLQGYMKGLTAKVFRTYNASKTMQDQMELIANEGTVAEKVLKYNAANRKVAILCNHQRTVGKGHSSSVEKIQERINEMEWQKLRLKRMILDLDPGAKTENPTFFAEIDDVTKEFLHKSVRFHTQKQEDLARRKWTRDNEKRSMEKQDLLTSEDLDAKLEKIQELKEQYEQEIESGVVKANGNASCAKLKSQIETLENRITTVTYQLKDKEDNSEVSLGTSKMNYIDPRLTVMFSKKFNVPIEKLFSKTLRDKFNWAIESTDADWRF